jgi:hypothetical protein
MIAAGQVRCLCISVINFVVLWQKITQTVYDKRKRRY